MPATVLVSLASAKKAQILCSGSSSPVRKLVRARGGGLPFETQKRLSVETGAR